MLVEPVPAGLLGPEPLCWQAVRVATAIATNTIWLKIFMALPRS